MCFCHSALKRSLWAPPYAEATSRVSSSVFSWIAAVAACCSSAGGDTTLRIDRTASTACWPRSCSNLARSCFGDAFGAARAGWAA
jgi:hypothetical protein